MLIPRGTTQGFPCEIFVMVSDYDLDKVDQDVVGVCNDAASFCGIRDRSENLKIFKIAIFIYFKLRIS